MEEKKIIINHSRFIIILNILLYTLGFEPTTFIK